MTTLTPASARLPSPAGNAAFLLSLMAWLSLMRGPVRRMEFA
jgi:hypothetical protein